MESTGGRGGEVGGREYESDVRASNFSRYPICEVDLLLMGTGKYWIARRFGNRLNLGMQSTWSTNISREKCMMVVNITRRLKTIKRLLGSFKPIFSTGQMQDAGHQ